VTQTVSGYSPAPIETADEGETLARIATGAQSAAAVVAAVREKQVKPRTESSFRFFAPRGAVEEALSRIWSECLNVEPIGVKDNFFDFGGTSLLATRALTHIRAEFGIELGLANLFAMPTVEEMAAHISGAQTQRG
jgi:acyl carrier protein